MKKKMYMIAACVIVIMTLFADHIYENIKDKKGIQESWDEKSIENITRATMAKMVSVLYYTSEEINSLDRVILYSDTDESKWYDKYINGVYMMGLIQADVETKKEKFRPEEDLTYGECIDLLKRICISQESSKKSTLEIYAEWLGKLNFPLETKDISKKITMAEWMQIYGIMVSGMERTGITKQELYIVGTSQSIDKLSEWETVTDKGIFNCEGLALSGCQDTKVSAYVKEKEILSIKAIPTDKVVLENVYLIKGEGKKLSVFVNGYRRNYELRNPLSQNINKVVGDLQIERGKIAKVSIKPDIIKDKVLLVKNKYIELEKYGRLELVDNYKIYSVFGTLKMESPSGILVGYNTTDFVLAGNKICAALIQDKVSTKNIRVLIKTTGYKSNFHTSVKLSANTDYTIYYGKKKKKVAKGKETSIGKKSKYLKGGRLRIQTAGGKGKIKLLSVSRSEGKNPSYRGKIEIVTNDEGLTIINELPMEEYLYAVIPSEMPTSYGLEPLKVQAICARSYAYRQLMANGCGEFGAHVDDSVSYQVYNNVPENKKSILAVKDTYGKVMKYDGEVINAYYFSTSCGYTASSDEVWFSDKKLPYLIGKLQTTQKQKKVEEVPDLSQEIAFQAFITKDLCKTYDSNFPWYRWQTRISLNDIKRCIDAKLRSRYDVNPNLILTLSKQKKYISKPINTVGTIKSIKVGKRMTGGIVTELIIEGSQNTIKVLTEYNIRTLLAPVYDNTIRKDNSVVANLSILPSAFFYMEPYYKEGKLKEYSLIGGGYGHGIGMSQNGTKAMADEKKTYEQILKHYYDGISISEIY